MEVQVTALSRRGSALMRRTWRVSARRVRFGRGTGNEIPLSDIRVDLAAAAMFPLGGGITIEALGPSPVRVNGVSAKASAVRPGDEISIGPYQIHVQQPGPGIDAALIIELVQPLGDSLDKLNSRSLIGLERTGISKRGLAWGGSLLVLLIGLLAPLMVYATAEKQLLRSAASHLNPVTLIALFWKPGDLSNSHRFFAAKCTTCHETPFTRVTDTACLGCHQDVGRHIPSGLQLAGMQTELESRRCIDCHQEHRGEHGIVVSDKRLCLSCHGAMAETTPAAGVSDVAGFPTGHPQFRATVVSDPSGPKTERVLLGGAPPINHPGIKFSHASHLVAGGFPALGIKQLSCAVCHTPEPGGQGFRAITYKEQCSDCHELNFDRQDLPWPNARVPHGDDTGIVAAVWNFYAGKALQGGIAESPPPAVTRRAAGSAVPETVSATGPDVRRWVADKSEAALRTVVLDDKRGCAYCHYGTGPSGAFTVSGLAETADATTASPPPRLVAPVALRTRFLPHAQFDHAKHTAVDCEHCHAGAQAAAMGQILIPGIETCAECHGSEKAALHAQSTCATCHAFHDKSLGRMRGVTAAAQ